LSRSGKTRTIAAPSNGAWRPNPPSERKFNRQLADRLVDVFVRQNKKQSPEKRKNPRRITENNSIVSTGDSDSRSDKSGATNS
jgi:hypothetical protein